MSCFQLHSNLEAQKNSGNTDKFNVSASFEKSARRDSNPRPRPWQGRAPPTEPLAHFISFGILQMPPRIFSKAGDGNRTHVSSLEGWCSTIELHPQIKVVTRYEQIKSYHILFSKSTSIFNFSKLSGSFRKINFFIANQFVPDL